MPITLPSFVDVGTQDPPEDGEASVVNVDGMAIALFNLGGQIYALSDLCVRCGASLALGLVAGTRVSCRQCSWCYDIISGRLTELPALVIDRFEVKVNDGHMVVATEPSAISSRWVA
ncbi:MAG: Rieske (2Fe-2S) protein [Burkholderiaceae bacterium]